MGGRSIDGVALWKHGRLDLADAFAFGFRRGIAVFTARAVARRARWLIALRAASRRFAASLRFHLRAIAFGAA